VAQLYACPFCRQMFAEGEVQTCPECDVKVQPLAELPPSHDAQVLEPEQQVPPEDEVLSWTYAGRGRGPLALLAVAGIAVFFAPWLHEAAPEIRTWSGYQFAQALGWLWAGGIGWLVMLGLVVSRRTIRQMRGARVAVGFLAATVLVTVAVRVMTTPKPHPYIPVRVAWGWGLYAAGGLAALAIAMAFRFGGAIDDLPTRQGRRGDEVIH
jgi:hypothetical protein